MQSFNSKVLFSKNYKYLGEEEQTALLLSYPLEYSLDFDGEQTSWSYDLEQTLSVFTVQHEKQNINIFTLNLKSSKLDKKVLSWMRLKILAFLKKYNLCSQRTILFTYFSPAVESFSLYENFLKDLGLVKLNFQTCLDEDLCLSRDFGDNLESSESLSIHISIHNSALFSSSSPLLSSEISRPSLASSSTTDLKKDTFTSGDDFLLTKIVRFSRCL